MHIDTLIFFLLLEDTITIRPLVSTYHFFWNIYILPKGLIKSAQRKQTVERSPSKRKCCLSVISLNMLRLSLVSCEVNTVCAIFYFYCCWKRNISKIVDVLCIHVLRYLKLKHSIYCSLIIFLFYLLAEQCIRNSLPLKYILSVIPQ